MSFQPPKGTDDLLSPRSQAWREALVLWEEWSARYGYALVQTPIFEATDLFERGVGDTSEVVTKQMYSFEDSGGRSITLRPEGTAGVVRAYLDSGIQGAYKGAYSGPYFRYERPQAGRRRQFYQVGIEYLGVPGPLADAEVIECGLTYLSALGVTQLEVKLNSIGDAVCRPEYYEALRQYLSDRSDDLTPDSVGLIERNPLRVLDSKSDGPKLVDAPKTTDYLCDACETHYLGVKEALDVLGVSYIEDSKLVRGLDYYTRTAFEYVGTGLDTAQNALGGGGRYDGLAELIGGRDTPGVGFALGLDRIMLALGDPEKTHLDAYLVSEVGPEEGLQAANQLRKDGLRIDLDLEGRSVKAQFRTARRLGAPVVLVFRGDGYLVDVQTDDERAEVPLQEVSVWFSKS